MKYIDKNGDTPLNSVLRSPITRSPATYDEDVRKKIRLAKYIIKKGVDVNRSHKHGNDLLNWIENGEGLDWILFTYMKDAGVVFLEFLIKKGLNIKLVNNSNLMLKYAIRHHHKKLAKMLIKAGVDLSYVGKAGKVESLLDYAIMWDMVGAATLMKKKIKKT